MSSETRNCQNCKGDFIIESDDFSFYEKMKVPAPHICSDCRFKMRAMWRNETSLYNRTCGKTGKSIISMYSPKLPYTVVSHEYYESDEFNPIEFGIDFKEDKPFWDQLNELLIKVPKVATFLSTGDGPNINSNYSNYAGGLKDCYIVFNCGPAEEVMYSRGARNVTDSVDLYFATKDNRCYECVNTHECSSVFWGQNVVGCVDSIFLSNCSGLTNCFGCVNLRNKSNCWFNEQLSREEYQDRLNQVLGSYKNMQEMWEAFRGFSLQFPRKENNNMKTVDSTGDYLFECKNVKDSFEISKGEDSKYLFSSKEIKDSIGTIGYGFRSDRLLECVGTGYSSNVIGSATVSNCRDIMYSYFLRNCHDCIGCDSLRNKEYCILNKQYTKEEYETIKNLIVDELNKTGVHGLVMPLSIAPFAYNETIAQDNFPLTKEEALAQGYRWEDDLQMTVGKETLAPEQIPDHIKDIPDTITKEILRCIDCNRNYKITEQELLFYKKMNLPIPRACFYCRHRDRIRRRGPYKFWDRKCDHCGKDIKTNYSPERKEIVYCEKCYQQEVI